MHITSVSVIGILMICGNLQGSDSLSENSADSVWLVGLKKQMNWMKTTQLE